MAEWRDERHKGSMQGGRTRVLIVDDDVFIRDLVRNLLEAEEYDLEEAASGDEALRAAAARPPDVVLLDIMMPGLDGYAVCRAIRANPALAGTVVVMLTAKDTPADRAAGMAAGASAYLTKPFSSLELFETIRGAVDGRRPV